MYQISSSKTYKRDKKDGKTNLARIAGISLLVLLIFLFVLKIDSLGSSNASYKIVEVQAGDTLWKLATTYNIDNQDPRRIVNRIKKINSLHTAMLQPGQKLKIPYQE